MGEELVNLPWLVIDDGTAEPETDVDFFQQIVVGGSHRSTVAEPGMSAMGRNQPVAYGWSADIRIGGKRALEVLR